MKGTKTFGILYKSKYDSNLISYTNSDWASNIGDRKSTNGYMFPLGSKVISLASKKQKTVALSLS